ncbi:MAG: DNA polymerase domain-containing protein [Candidatus Odinarchaeota archaeon]
MRGWILDITAQPDHLTLWLRTAEACVPLEVPYQPRFYLHAPGVQFEDYAPLFESHPHVSAVTPEFHRLQLRGPRRPVLAVSVSSCTQLPRVVRELKALAVPRFRVFNGDLSATQLWYLEQQRYPFEQVEVHTNESRTRVTRIDSCDSQLALDYELPPFDTVDLRLEGEDLFTASSSKGNTLQTTEPMMLQDWITAQDPDIIFTERGDSHILPALIQRVGEGGMLQQFSLNRDHTPHVFSDKALPAGRAVFRYGGPVFYRPHPFILRGRLHLDRSYMTFGDFHGLIEGCRLTAFPPQRMARSSPGTGINMLQMQEALRRGVLIPETKADPEQYKTGIELLNADRGGHVITPRVGVFSDVGELDFLSMYPSLMVKHNISPEALFCDCCPDDATVVPELGYWLCRREIGIVPTFLKPILEKRTYYKKHRHDNPIYEARQSALKWLLVVSFGYLGFRASRFGRVEAYECVTAFSRRVLLQTKAVSEQRGFQVLHGIVDCVWLQKSGATVDDYLAVGEAIQEKTGLPIEFEGRYRWIMFLPCRNQPYGALTRYCGVKEDGTIKVRGIELRRRDTPPYIKQLQLDLLTCLAGAEDADEMQEMLPQLLDIVKGYLERLHNGDVAIDDLVITQNISRSPGEYQQQCSQAIAAELAVRYGQDIQPGQPVRYVHTDAQSRYPLRRVALPHTSAATHYDKDKYAQLLLRATDTLLTPLGWNYDRLVEHFNEKPIQTILDPYIRGSN